MTLREVVRQQQAKIRMSYWAQAAEMRLGAPEEELPAFRRHPLGQDSQGFIYWYCDCWETTGVCPTAAFTSAALTFTTKGTRSAKAERNVSHGAADSMCKYMQAWHT